MGGKSKLKDKWKSMPHKKKIWIVFTVIPTLAPVILTILFDFYYEYTLQQIYRRHILELILVNFAILVNLFCEAIDFTDQEKRKVYVGITGAIGCITFAIYCFCYGKNPYVMKYTIFTAIFFVVLAITTMRTGLTLYNTTEEKAEKG